MSKGKKIAYWIFTCWLALGLVSVAIVQLGHSADEMVRMQRLGYPNYLLPILGVWKLLAAVAVLVPGVRVLKEWAYAGIFFMMSGALLSHLICHHSFSETGPSLLLLTISVLSWALRPENRKIATFSK